MLIKRALIAFIIHIPAYVLLFLAAYLMGQASVKQVTVVRLATPYYVGSYFGKCATVTLDTDEWDNLRFEACATDGR
jgi:hypothetical protein